MKKILLSLSAALVLSGVQAQNAGDLDGAFGIGGYALSDPYALTGELYWDMITLSDDKIVKVGFTDDGGDTDILVAKFLENGTPDSTFGVNGFAQIDMSLGGDEDARGIFELSNGQLLITGYVTTQTSLDAYVMRLESDGTVDFTFGVSPGHTKLNTGENLIAYGRSVVAVGTDIFVGGAALVNGQGDIMVAKLDQDGVLDGAFASAGYSTMDVAGGNDNLESMALKANGAFILGGYADSLGTQLGFVGSITQFGTPTSYGNSGTGAYTFDDGSGYNEVNDVYVDANDNAVFVGTEGTFPNVQGIMKRLTPTGDLDVTFGFGGEVISDPGATTGIIFRSIVATQDGDYVAIGNTDGASMGIYALMVDSTGSFVNFFGGGTDVTVPFGAPITSLTIMAGAVQSTGSIVIGGYFEGQGFTDQNMVMIRLFGYQDDSSVEEITNVKVNVYPNPAQNEFKIDMENINQVQLISVQGKVVKTWAGQSSYDLPQNLTPGVYMLHVQTDVASGVTRLMVK